MSKYLLSGLLVVLLLIAALSGCSSGSSTPSSYNVSGNVVLQNENALEGVTINFSGGFSSVSTNLYGGWFKNNLTGTVIVTPSLTGYRFNPTQVSVDGARADVNFVAIPYKIAYIYNPLDTDDNTSAGNFETFLDPHYPTDLITKANIESTDFSGYSLIIISRRASFTDAQATYIHNNNLPVIRIHGGGLAYFAKVTSSLNGGNVASGSGTQVAVLDATLPIWSQPNNLNVTTGSTLTIFNSASHIDCFYYPYLEAGGIHIGRDTYSSSYDSINQVGNNLYWGYANDSSDFTTAGQNLFLNAIAYMIE